MITVSNVIANRLRGAFLALSIILQTTAAFAGSAYSNDAYPFTSTEDATRFATLTNEIRCVVCQHQSIAESNSPIAESLRHKIYTMILAKKSNGEINDYLVKRYGEFILLNPRVSQHTILLWSFPALLFIIAGYIFFRTIQRICPHAGTVRVHDESSDTR